MTNSGTIVVTAAQNAGVYFLNGGTLNNSGTITASGYNSMGRVHAQRRHGDQLRDNYRHGD